MSVAIEEMCIRDRGPAGHAAAHGGAHDGPDDSDKADQAHKDARSGNKAVSYTHLKGHRGEPSECFRR